MYEEKAEEEMKNRALSKLLTWKLLGGSMPYHERDKARRLADRTLSIYQQGRAGELTYKDLGRHDRLLTQWESHTGQSFETSLRECRAEIDGIPPAMLALSL